MSVTQVPVPLSDPKYDEISDILIASYPNICILWIDKLTNAELDQKFEARRALIQKNRGTVVVKTLYHGAAQENISNILFTGFDAKRNITSAYGKGTYFATAATLSSAYAKPNKSHMNFMIVADVLIGKTKVGTANETIDTRRFDNCVNDVNYPTIYVTPYDDGAIPRYLVAFHKDAR